jgi:hypothetical protein
MTLRLLFPLFVAFFACDSTPEAPPDTTQPVEIVEEASLELDVPETTPDVEAAEEVAPEAVEEAVAETTPDVIEDTHPEVTDDTSPAPACVSDSDCAPGTLCIDDTCTCDPTPVSFADDIVPLFASTCGASCHVVSSATGGSAGLNLKAAFAHAELVSVDASQCRNARADQLRVVPGDVGKSYLMDKLLGTNMCTGTRMPKGGSKYSAARLSMVGRWICQGAPNN